MEEASLYPQNYKPCIFLWYLPIHCFISFYKALLAIVFPSKRTALDM